MKTENKQTETVSRKNLIDEAAAIRKMSFVSVAGNAVLSGFKFFAGVTGNSGAMISDSIHSFSDVITTVIAWIGVKASKKEADSAHPYGHERMECIASLFLGIILLATGLGVGKVGLENIISGDYETLAIPGTISLVAAIVSIVSKEAMYWYTRYYARLINSSAFLADAWHHRSDAFSSIGSLIGIGGAMLGFPVMDSVASVVICLFKSILFKVFLSFEKSCLCFFFTWFSIEVFVHDKTCYNNNHSNNTANNCVSLGHAS